jgi:hypothetical protein
VYTLTLLSRPPIIQRAFATSGAARRHEGRHGLSHDTLGPAHTATVIRRALGAGPRSHQRIAAD